MFQMEPSHQMKSVEEKKRKPNPPSLLLVKKSKDKKTRFDTCHVLIEVIDRCLYLGLRPLKGLSLCHMVITDVTEFGESRAPRARPRSSRRLSSVAPWLRYDGGIYALT